MDPNFKKERKLAFEALFWLRQIDSDQPETLIDTYDLSVKIKQSYNKQYIKLFLEWLFFDFRPETGQNCSFAHLKIWYSSNQKFAIKQP